MANVLIIDDEEGICKLLTKLMRQMGHQSETAQSIREGLARAEAAPYDVVFLDVRLPDGSGLDILPKIRSTPLSPEVIIMTGYGDADGAEIAIKNGAWDYLQKPISPQEILLPLKRVFQYRDNLKAAQKPAVMLKHEGIIGSSPQILASLDLVAQAAGSDASVLISGETGTGKELFARAIHVNSRRANGNLVVVDCAALPETLLESTLFGHEKGAFTGADRTREGLVKQADGGTLFLDEIGELPLPVQRGFLRVLEEHRFRPVGAREEKTSDFRVVAATNQNLERMAQQGSFRQDLLFRLRSVSIELPPLRDRVDDIKELVLYHLTNLCDIYGIKTKGFSPDFLEALSAYQWPGNVRELVNAMERSVTAARHEPILFAKHLPDHIRIKLTQSTLKERRPPLVEGKDPEPSDFHGDLPTFQDFKAQVLDAAERRYLENLMERTAGNISEASRQSGLGRTWLYTLLKKHQLL
ncbi:MAG: sigma-54 dependent transcriptional regulator [Thermodesulfobacteriota bacterium]